ncbi:substrate-binding periplasmic protein [Chitinimonas sp. JJ19]|uniref:substrate-binding periplasmic protein n=1 Tax=Chitinimonas sp. JJ19 TaxID=3109352 RepID=UPI001A3B8038|nr:transporter substrate-binding domain-containing protein [Chitinimonas sp.]
MRRYMLAALLCWLGVACAQPLVYLRHQGEEDPHLRYMVAVLQLAIAESGSRYQVQPSKMHMVQSRALDEIRRNSGLLDLVWTMTSVERERELLPIRIPVDRGLIGWRVALLKQDRLKLLSGVRDLADLRQFSAGQMHDWPDTSILRHNGLPVEASDQYEGLFRMLAAGRFDYFPRSVIEIRDELRSHPGMGLAIEPRLLIRYPTALYFFVSRDRQKLALDLERGLEKAVREGKLQALFQRYYGPLLLELNVANRQVVELANPLLPKETPLGRPELWYRPGDN